MANSVEKKQYIWERRVMGVLVLLLAPLSVLFGLIGMSTNPAGWWYSISDTYYANSSVVMAAIIAICAFFFCTYGGYDWKDRVVNLMSGIGLFGLLVFPNGNIGMKEANELVGLFNLPANISGICHDCFAILAFCGFFFNEMFVFTLTNGDVSDKKKQRNLLYRISACCVPVAGVIITLGILGVIPFRNFIWIAEFIALEPCGIAWLVKGEALSYFNDKE